MLIFAWVPKSFFSVVLNKELVIFGICFSTGLTFNFHDKMIGNSVYNFSNFSRFLYGESPFFGLFLRGELSVGYKLLSLVIVSM